MSQVFGERDFGIAREARRRLSVGILVVQFNLKHDGLVNAYRMPTIKCAVKSDPGTSSERMKRST